MKEIPLTKGKVTLVDDSDYPELIKHKWCAVKMRNIWYAVRSIRQENGTRILTGMHRILLNTPKGMLSDHINGDGLDNRRANLRIVTNRENQQNQHIQKYSKYPGVTYRKDMGKWNAQIHINGKRKSLGHFLNELDAARAYIDECEKLREGLL